MLRDREDAGMLRIALAMMILAGAGLTACTPPEPATKERHCKGEAADCGRAAMAAAGAAATERRPAFFRTQDRR
jgi:hypothetical protein